VRRRPTGRRTPPDLEDRRIYFHTLLGKSIISPFTNYVFCRLTSDGIPHEDSTCRFDASQRESFDHEVIILHVGK